MAVTYPAHVSGYARTAGSTVLIPDHGAPRPKVGDWRTSRKTKVVDGMGKPVFTPNGNPQRKAHKNAPNQYDVEILPMRGIKGVDNTDNPLALGGRVFTQVDESADLWSPNAGKTRGLIECLAIAVETGSVSIDDLDAKTRRRVERHLGIFPSDL